MNLFELNGLSHPLPLPRRWRVCPLRHYRVNHACMGTGEAYLAPYGFLGSAGGYLTISNLFIFLFLFSSFTEASVELSWNLKSGYHQKAQPYDHLLGILGAVKQKSKPSNLSSNASLQDQIRAVLSLPSLQEFLAETATAEIFLEKVEDGFLSQFILVRDPLVGEFFCQLLLPFHVDDDRFPALLALHGHGENAESFSERSLIQNLVLQGVVVIIPWFRAMRRIYEDEINPKLMRLGFPLMGIRIYEALRAIEVLKNLKIVDLDRLGVIGHSGGSSIASLVSYCTPAIKACVSDYETSFGENQDSGCCEHLPKLRGIASQIHEITNHPCPLLKAPYNYSPREDQVLDFLRGQLNPPGISSQSKTLLATTKQAVNRVRAISVQALVKTSPSITRVENQLTNLIQKSLAIPHPSMRDEILAEAGNLGIFLGTPNLASKALKDMTLPFQALELRLKLMSSLKTHQAEFATEFEKISDLCSSFEKTENREAALAWTAARLAEKLQIDFAQKLLSQMQKTSEKQEVIDSLHLVFEAMLRKGKVEAFLLGAKIFQKPQNRISLMLEGSKRLLQKSKREKLLREAQKTLLKHGGKLDPTLTKLFQIQLRLSSQSRLSKLGRAKLDKTLKSLSINSFPQTKELLKTLLFRDQFRRFSILLPKLESVEAQLELLVSLYTESGSSPAQTQFLLKSLEEVLPGIHPPRDRLPFMRVILNETGDNQKGLLFKTWFIKAINTLDNARTKFERIQDEFFGLLEIAVSFGKTELILETLKRFPNDYPMDHLISKVFEFYSDSDQGLWAWKFADRMSKTTLRPSTLSQIKAFQKKYENPWENFLESRETFLHHVCFASKLHELLEPHHYPIHDPSLPALNTKKCLARLLQPPGSKENIERALILYRSQEILSIGDKRQISTKIIPRILEVKEDREEIDQLLMQAIHGFQTQRESNKIREAQSHIKGPFQSLLARVEVSQTFSFEKRVKELSEILILQKKMDTPEKRADILLELLSLSPLQMPVAKIVEIINEIQEVSHNLEPEDIQSVSQNLMEYCLNHGWGMEAVEKVPLLGKFLSPRAADVSLSQALNFSLLFHRLGQVSKSREWLRNTLKAIWGAFPSSESLVALRDLSEERQHQQLALPDGLLKELARQLAHRVSREISNNEEFCETIEEIKSSESMSTLEPLVEVCR
jgi:hypothetical protein